MKKIEMLQFIRNKHILNRICTLRLNLHMNLCELINNVTRNEGTFSPFSSYYFVTGTLDGYAQIFNIRI